MQNFRLLFISLLIAQIVQNSHTLTRICFSLFEKSPETNLKAFQHRTWTSIDRLEKQLLNKTKFSTFLQLSCSNGKLKLR